VSEQSNISRRRLKYVATVNDDVLQENTDEDYLLQYIDIGNVNSSGSIQDPVAYRFKDVPSRARRRVRHGDIIVSCVRTYLQAIAHIKNPPANLVVSTGFAVVRSSQEFLNPNFAIFALRDPRFLAEIEKRSVGVSYPAINASDLADISISLPSLREQHALCAYLNRETTRLEALIREKQRVLGLLGEKRRALITRAVTRGLDPNVSFRNSGLQWLGEIPTHWEVVALRFLVDSTSGATPDTRKREYWDGEIPWVTPKDMKQDEIIDSLDHVSELALSECVLRLIERGAVLIVVRGMILAHSFPAAVSAKPVTINQDMKALRCCPRLTSHYLRDCFHGLEQHIVSLADSSAHGTRKLDSEVLGSLGVPLPPLWEQEQIVAYIGEATSKLNALQSAIERSIALLKERRTALIATTVTGQIDIGGAA